MRFRNEYSYSSSIATVWSLFGWVLLNIMWIFVKHLVVVDTYIISKQIAGVDLDWCTTLIQQYARLVAGVHERSFHNSYAVCEKSLVEFQH